MRFDDNIKDLNDFISNLPEVILNLNAEFEIEYINNKGVEVFGYDYKDIIKSNIFDHIDSDDHQLARETVFLIMEGEDYSVGEVNFLLKNSSVFPGRISSSPVIVNGIVAGYRCVIFNIYRKQYLMEMVELSEERFRRFSESALEGIIFYKDEIIIDANKAMLEMFNYSLNEVVDKNIKEFFRPDHHEILNKNSNKEWTSIEIEAYSRSRGAFSCEVFLREHVFNGEKISMIDIKDVSHRKRVEYLSEHDEFTELYNSAGFFRRLRTEISSVVKNGSRFAVMMMKVYPDEFNVIKNIDPDLENVLYKIIPLEISERLKTIFFESDTIARVEQDEYFTIQPIPEKYNIVDMVKVINKALGIFEKCFVNDIKMRVNIGVTFFPDDYSGENPVKIISNCKHACDVAINQKKEFMFYDEKSHIETREKIEFIKDLIIAVKEEKCINFVLYYQPKVNRELMIVGMEALIRWNHPKWNDPELGLVPPSKFIEIAEDIGLISDIGNWVLFTSCKQVKVWQELRPYCINLKLSVNVSPSQLNYKFIEIIDSVVLETGIAPETLELEITERETVKEKNIRILDSIRERNISIAIDDFGIDYSSLSKLPKLPIDTIKLDKSYINDIITDKDYDNLVNHTINMVHSLRYEVVAEGVENEEQARKLFEEMNCDIIQGFYYYVPLTAEEFSIKLKKCINRYGIFPDLDN